MSRTSVKADPDWFVVTLIRGDETHNHSLNYEPIIAWDIDSGYATPVCINSYDENKSCIKSPDGLFRFVEDCELLLEIDVIVKFLDKDPPKATKAQG